MQTLSASSASDYILLEKGAKKPKGKKAGRKFEVLSNADIEDILSAAKRAWILS